MQKYVLSIFQIKREDDSRRQETSRFLRILKYVCIENLMTLILWFK